MRLLKLSTSYDLMVFMTDATDHVTGKTGLTLTLTSSKAGGAFASITPTVTELGNGWYSLALTTSHTDTVGDLAIRATGTDADPTDLICQVRANVLGDTLPGNVTQWKGSVPADLVDTDKVSVSVTHKGVLNDLSTAQVNTEIDTALADVGLTTTVTGRIDATISTRSSHSAADVWTSGTRTLSAFGFSVTLASGAITASVFATDAITAAALAADAVAEIQAGLSTYDASVDEVLANLVKVEGSASGITEFGRAIHCIGRGTVDAGSSTVGEETLIPVKTLNIDVDDTNQLLGRILMFPADAGTGLKLQASDIRGVDVTGTSGTVIRVTALTRNPPEDAEFLVQ